MGKMNRKQKFMFNHLVELTLYYKQEAIDNGYETAEQISKYVHSTLHACTFVGTKRELKKEFQSKNDYVVICRGLFLYAVEAFNGKEYNILDD